MKLRLQAVIIFKDQSVIQYCMKIKDIGKIKSAYMAVIVLSILALVFSIIILIQKTSYNPIIDNFCMALNSHSQCENV